MNWIELQKHFSAARMGRYLAACGGDTNRAAVAYADNILLAEAMLPLLNGNCVEKWHSPAAVTFLQTPRLVGSLERRSGVYAAKPGGAERQITIAEATALTSHRFDGIEPDMLSAQPRFSLRAAAVVATGFVGATRQRSRSHRLVGTRIGRLAGAIRQAARLLDGISNEVMR